MTAEDLLKRTLRYLQKTDSLNVLAEDIEKYLAEPKKPMTEAEIACYLANECLADWDARVFKWGISIAEKFHGIGGVDND